MHESIHLISPDNFADEVLSSPKPVLLLCMPRSDDFASQIKLLEDIAEACVVRLAVGLLAEAFTEYFKTKLDIHGTPTYLIFVQGEEKNRLLGVTDFQALEQFVLEALR